MANSQRMDVCQSSECLVGIELHQDHRDCLLHLVVMLQDSEDCFGHIVHDDVQINLVWLISLGVEGMLQSYHVRVEQLLHYLKLSVFVSLILVHFFYCNLLVVFVHGCLEYDTETAVSDYSIGIVRK